MIAELIHLIAAFPTLPMGDQVLFAVLVASVSFLIAAICSPRRGRKRRWRIHASRRMLKKLSTLETFGQKIDHLRRVDAFLFEEAILSAFENQGYRVKRNHRYTGDGGLDGQVWISGKRYLIQAKRYSGHIRKQHLREFDQLCLYHGCHGLFMHTGRTGGGAKASCTDRVVVVSGQQLLDILEGRSPRALLR